MEDAMATKPDHSQTAQGPASAPIAATIVAYPQAAIKRRQLTRAESAPNPWLERASAVAAQVVPTLLMVAVLLLVWQMLCVSPDSNFPSPVKVWEESHQVIVDPFKGVQIGPNGLDIDGTGDVGIAGHVLTSLSRVLYGYAIAAVIGIGLGILVGQSIIAYRALDPLFQILRTVPPLAWLPISLSIFQQAQPSAIFLIFITAIWPIILNTAAGVQNIPAAYVNVGKVLGLNPLEYFLRIMLPATVPHMFTGLRIGVGMSWLAIVASEMLLGGVGVGFFIWDQYNSSRISDIVVALIWVGLVGFVLDRAVALLGNFISRGSAKA
jgi:nitrate/nitrite transport system permease protein